jgi:Glycosyl transferases group 1
VRDLRLDGHVELQDRLVPVEHLPEVIAAADVGIVPYRDDVFTDGLVPTKLLEYAAMALPCVVARTTAVHTTFGDSVAAYFTPGDLDDLVDAIRGLWEQPAARERLESGSRSFTRRHNWAQEGREYTALVTRLGRPGAHPGPGTERDTAHDRGVCPDAGAPPNRDPQNLPVGAAGPRANAVRERAEGPTKTSCPRTGTAW